MPELTPETVAAAHVAREVGSVNRETGIYMVSMGACIENEHFDTLAELSRQQHEGLRVARVRLNRVCLDTDTMDVVLALWPDEGAEDTDE